MEEPNKYTWTDCQGCPCFSYDDDPECGAGGTPQNVQYTARQYRTLAPDCPLVSVVLKDGKVITPTPHIDPALDPEHVAFELDQEIWRKANAIRQAQARLRWNATIESMRCNGSGRGMPNTSYTSGPRRAASLCAVSSSIFSRAPDCSLSSSDLLMPRYSAYSSTVLRSPDSAISLTCPALTKAMIGVVFVPTVPLSRLVNKL